MPEEKSMYSLPSTSRRTQPLPDSKATGQSFTWPLRPLTYLVQRACGCFESGAGAGTGMCGTRVRSTRPQSRVEKDWVSGARAEVLIAEGREGVRVCVAREELGGDEDDLRA